MQLGPDSAQTNSNMIDLTLENFQQVMLEVSVEKVVIVYFYAQVSPDSISMLNDVETVILEAGDSVLLARVDCDKSPEIAGQFGIRDLPTLYVVKDKQPVDGFAGKKTTQELKELLANHLPDPTMQLIQQCDQLFAVQDYAAAMPLLKQAFESQSNNAEIKIRYAEAMVETGQIESGKALVDTIGFVDQDSDYERVVGKLALAEQAKNTPEIQALRDKVAENPDDLNLKTQLAIQLQQVNENAEALDLIFAVLEANAGFEDTRKLAIDMINALADGDPLKSAARRRLYSFFY